MLAVPTYIITLDRNVERRTEMQRQLKNQDHLDVHFISAVYGAALPRSALSLLSENDRWAENRGAIGCFLSHVKVWETVAGLGADYAMILEDDVNTDRISRIKDFNWPLDTDLIYISDRMSPNGHEDSQTLSFTDIRLSLSRLNDRKSGSGSDGYLLTPSAAKILVEAVSKDRFYGHVDGRLLRYSVDKATLGLFDGTWIYDIIATHHNLQNPPMMGILRSKASVPALVKHGGWPSSREMDDNRGV